MSMIDVEVRCENDDATLTVVTPAMRADAIAWESARMGDGVAQLRRVISGVLHDTIDVEGAVCPFAGEVEAHYHPDVRRVSWTCPVCGHDNMTEHDPRED